jgi:hypothetical protein
MIFIFGIIFGLVFAFMAVKMKFYESWMLFVNVLLSVYLGIFAGPWIVDFAGLEKLPFALVSSVLGTVVVSFIVLYSITYIYFISQFRITFGKIFDFLGAGGVGFLTGFLVWSLISILLCNSLDKVDIPMSSQLGIDRTACRGNVKYLGWWCGIVHTFTAAEDNPKTASRTIIELTKRITEQMSEKQQTKPQTRPKEPACEPNNTDVNNVDISNKKPPNDIE